MIDHVVYMGIYKVNELDQIYPSTEHQSVPIDPPSIFGENNRIEVHVHGSGKEMAVSPNNGSFLMNALNPAISFYGVTALKSRKGIYTLMICLYYIPYLDIPFSLNLNYL